MVVGWSGFDNGTGLKKYPSTRKRTPAVMRAEEIRNKRRREPAVLLSSMLRKGPAVEAHVLLGENIVQTVARLFIYGLRIEEDVNRNVDG